MAGSVYVAIGHLSDVGSPRRFQASQVAPTAQGASSHSAARQVAVAWAVRRVAPTRQVAPTAGGRKGQKSLQLGPA